MAISKCEICNEDCPQAQGKHEAALGRMYAMRELVKCAPYWDALFDENEKPKITPARLRELVEADREGRCVVLPCKVGDSVWVTMAYGKQYNPPVHGQVHKFVLHDDEIVYLESIIWMDIGYGGKGYGYTEKSFGKAVFLTCEAAEVALRGN